MQPIIRGIIPYCDTVRIIYPALTDAEFESIWQSLRAYIKHNKLGSFHPETWTASKLKARRKKHDGLGKFNAVKEPQLHDLKRHRNGSLTVNLNQPSPAMLKEISEWIGRYKVRLVGVDVAVDFMGDDVPALRRWLERHHVQKNRRQGTQVKFYGSDPSRGIPGTRYSRDEKAGRGVVIYSDRLSKISGQPCCHIEARVRTLQSLRGVGLRPHDLPTLSDQATLMRIFDKLVAFVDWSDEKIERGVAGKQTQINGKPGISGGYWKVGRIAARAIAAQLGEHRVTATAIYELCKRFGFRVQRMTVPMMLITTPPIQPQQ